MRWHMLAMAMLVLLGTVEVLAQSAVVRPQRLVHRFDFEERELGNYEDMPMHWYPIGRSAHTSEPGFHRQPLHRQLIERRNFPRHTQVRFDTRHALTGEHSFYLGLDGGNAGAYLEVGTLPVVPGSDYLVVAHVRTAHLTRAAVQVTAYFIDADGHRIDPSAQTSKPIRSNDDWLPVTINLVGEHPEAAWIGMELELLQPVAKADHPLRGQQIVLPDVKGEAWFDDISVWQVPHLEVGAQNAVNVVAGAKAPQLTAMVRDLTGRQLSAELTVYDHAGRLMERHRQRIGEGGLPRWTWRPDLPGHGWYLVDMVVHDHDDPSDGGSPVSKDEPIARTLGAFLWLPAEEPMDESDASRFGLLAEDVPVKQLQLLPKVLHTTGLQRAVISAWDRETTRLTIDQRVQMLDELVQELAPAQQSLGMSLHPLPRELIDRLDQRFTQPIEVFSLDEEAWLPYLRPMLMRHGPRVQQWHLGTPIDATAFYTANLPQLLERIDRQFRAMAPRPSLLLPWSLDQSRRPDLPSSREFVVDVSPGVVAEHLPAHLEHWQAGGRAPWLVLRSWPADRVGHEQRVIDLTLRMLHAWAQEPAGLMLPTPWTGSAEREPAVLPDPLLGVFRNVVHRLAGRRVVGELPVGEGLRCWVLNGPAGGMLVAWNEQAEQTPEAGEVGEVGEVAMYLGQQPMAVDVWGNRKALPEREGRHVVQLGRTPMFIEGIDVELALFRASFKLDEPFIESSQVPHQRVLELTNPWPRTVSGRLQMVGPAGWQISPAQHHFSIAAGQTLRLPVEFTFPIMELAGPKRLRARFDFTADQQYKAELGTPMQLGLTDVAFDATLTMEPGGDAVATCILTNTGEAVLALYVFANLRDHPRQERIVARLAPGESVVRRFRFADALAILERGHPVRVGVRETNGPAILNQLLRMEDAR